MKIQHIESKRLPCVWTALITPLLPDGTVDFNSLSNIARAQEEAGNGILLLGSTGEGLALSEQEQLAVVHHVCQLALSVPIMVAVGGYQLAVQERWIQACNELRVSAYLLATPLYAKPGPSGLTQWFSTLLDCAKHPCMLYNVPSRSGVNIPVSTVQQLQNHPNCWAMKEASGDLATFLSYKQHCPEIALFSGEDAMMPYLAGAGVEGLVSVSANAWPKETRAYVEKALRNEHHGLFPVWQNAVDALFQVANPIPVKVLMKEKGMIASATLRAPLTEHEIPKNHQLQQVDQLIENWFSENHQQVIGVQS